MHPRPHQIIDTSAWHELDRADRIRNLRAGLAQVVQAIMRETESAHQAPSQVEELHHLELIIRLAADFLIELGHMGPQLQQMYDTLAGIRDSDQVPQELRDGLTRFLAPLNPEGEPRRATQMPRLSSRRVEMPIQASQPRPLVPNGFG